IDLIASQLVGATGIEEVERVLAGDLGQQAARQLTRRQAFALGLTTEALGRLVVKVDGERGHTATLRCRPPRETKQANSPPSCGLDVSHTARTMSVGFTTMGAASELFFPGSPQHQQSRRSGWRAKREGTSSSLRAPK